MNSATYFIPDESAMLNFGMRLAASCIDSAVIFLYGSLGAGKTTLTRGFLRGLGYQGMVKSPTYTIVESYEINHIKVFHFDLYRLHTPAELEYIGIQDYFAEKGIYLIEWPEKGEGWLPLADLSCYIEPYGVGREIRIIAHTACGKEMRIQLEK